LQITEFLWLQDVYDEIGDIGVGYHEPGAWWLDNWLSIGQEKVLIFISIVFILICINGESFDIYLNSIHTNIYYWIVSVSNANDLPICRMLFGSQISFKP
jgi:hypothetical protein